MPTAIDEDDDLSLRGGPIRRSPRHRSVFTTPPRCSHHKKNRQEVSSSVALRPGKPSVNVDNDIAAACTLLRSMRDPLCALASVAAAAPPGECYFHFLFCVLSLFYFHFSHIAFASAKCKPGRPKKRKGQRKRYCLYREKKKAQGAAVKAKRGRAAKRGARSRMAAAKTAEPMLPPLPGESSPTERDIRGAIAVLLKTWHAGADRGEWLSISRAIADQLRCEYRTVYRVIEKMSEGTPPEKRREGGGRPNRIVMGSAKADVLVGSLRGGFGVRHTALFINELGVSPGKKPIHKGTVARIAKKQFGMVVGKRQTTKTGSRDVTSSWAVSRKAIVSQWRNDLATKRYEIEGTLFVDEHSEFCILGSTGHHGQANKHEWRGHLKEGQYCHQRDGGVLEPQVPYRKPKNAARADGIFGVCAPTPLGGRRREGRTMTPCRYRNKVIGMAAFAKAQEAEFERVRVLGRNALNKGTRSVWSEFVRESNPYEARYGDEWRHKMPRSFGVTSVKVLVDHVIDEGNRLFADTRFANTWCIYHDALAQWWEVATQQYIASRGFRDRQWRSNAETDKVISKYYVGKLMGDSPELMPLDSSLFSDQIENVARLVVGTSSLAEEERYTMATPNKAWTTMVAAWTMLKSDRIIQDVDRFVPALNAIIAAEGAYVADKDLRNGHRRLMRRLVRGGVPVQGAGGVSTAARLAKGLEEAKKSWEGLTAKYQT